MIHCLQETAYIHPGQQFQASRHFESVVTIPTSGNSFLHCQLFQWHHSYFHSLLRPTRPHCLLWCNTHIFNTFCFNCFQGRYDVVALQAHIMCQHSQALHMKCFLGQTKKSMCSHFKPNPMPGLNNITQADITFHIYLLCVLLSGPQVQPIPFTPSLHPNLSTLSLCAIDVQTIAACPHINSISADSSISC